MTVQPADQPAIVPLPTRLTRDEVTQWVRSIQPQLQAARSAGHAVLLDASALRQFDSSALAALLALRREILAQGMQFAGVAGMSATLQSLADVYGIEELLPPSAPDAADNAGS
ncbi:STAS domain-containing protein [Vandammella animalimorsus]|uniref:STAS domain-containing protein n=1 Tax=Vandammella animalimorsus TaxID=2029117 RepID=UPI001EED63CD|nr:STAS domain-containing protein [Vandammella animalimorsus]